MTFKFPKRLIGPRIIIIRQNLQVQYLILCGYLDVRQDGPRSNKKQLDYCITHKTKVLALSISPRFLHKICGHCLRLTSINYALYQVLNILERELIGRSLGDKLIIILNIQPNPMNKYNKVYLRNKKESNISLPLRYSFLQSIFVDNMTVKEAALKWKIHYSSAKIIARTAKRNKLYSVFQEKKIQSGTKIQCSYRHIDETSLAQSPNSDIKEEQACNNSESLTHFSQSQTHKIEIQSTIGWNYNSQGFFPTY